MSNKFFVVFTTFFPLLSNYFLFFLLIKAMYIDRTNVAIAKTANKTENIGMKTPLKFSVITNIAKVITTIKFIVIIIFFTLIKFFIVI